MIGKKNKLFRYAFLLVIFIGAAFLLFNDSGYIKYLKLKDEVESVRNEAGKNEIENKNLEAEIDSLEKNNPAKIEKEAREKYGMMKKGEKVIKVEVK